MTRRFALKKLTRSDLTLFRWHFENNNAGNQKAINLNADVFVRELFPAAPAEARVEGRSGRFSVDLDIFGPNGAPRMNLQRKIVKFGEYKNWRLNGEFVDNPVGAPSRFNSLVEGDFAILEFSGGHFPEAVRLMLVSRSDAALHAACNATIGSKSMVALGEEALDTLVAAGGGPDVFPLAGTSVELALEDAAQGGIEGARKLQMRASSRPVTRDELGAARAKAEEIGMAGEEFVNDYLTKKGTAGELSNLKWQSIENAVAAFDFSYDAHGVGHLIDVKATRGNFENRIHVSLNELLHMRDSGAEYRVFRVFEMTEQNAVLRVTEPLREFAASILPTMEGLPNGVTVDGVSIDPRILRFGPPISLELRDDDE